MGGGRSRGEKNTEKSLIFGQGGHIVFTNINGGGGRGARNPSAVNSKNWPSLVVFLLGVKVS